MTSIIDVLRPYQVVPPLPTPEATKSLETILYGGKLAYDLTVLASNSSGWSFFRGALYDHLGRDNADDKPMWWGDVAGFCDYLGFQDFDPLASWIDGMSTVLSPDVVAKLYRSQAVTLPTPEIVYGAEIRDAVLATGKVMSNASWEWDDSTYGLLTEQDLQTVLNACPVDQIMHYQSTTMDCEDFSRAVRGWMSMYGIGNRTIGECSIALYDGQGNTVGLHSCLLAYFKDTSGAKVIKHIEPQDFTVHDVGSAWVAQGIGGAVRSELFRIRF